MDISAINVKLINESRNKTNKRNILGRVPLSKIFFFFQAFLVLSLFFNTYILAQGRITITWKASIDEQKEWTSVRGSTWGTGAVSITDKFNTQINGIFEGSATIRNTGGSNIVESFSSSGYYDHYQSVYTFYNCGRIGSREVNTINQGRIELSNEGIEYLKDNLRLNLKIENNQGYIDDPFTILISVPVIKSYEIYYSGWTCIDDYPPPDYSDGDEIETNDFRHFGQPGRIYAWDNNCTHFYNYVDVPLDVMINGEPISAHWEVTIEAEECKNEMKDEKQFDPDWNEDPYGLCKKRLTIGSDGCGLTSLSMLLTSIGYPINPSALNNWMKEKQKENEIRYYNGCNVNWVNTTAGVTNGEYRFNFRGKRYGGPYDSMREPDLTREILEQILCEERSVAIVGVKIEKVKSIEKVNHWVLVTGMECGKFIMSDPGSNNRYLEDKYPWYKVRGYGVPNSNNREMKSILLDTTDYTSALHLSVNNSANISIRNPEGQFIGFDPVYGEYFSEIPYSVFFHEGLMNNITGEKSSDWINKIHIPEPIKGEYLITLIQSEPEEFELYINGFFSNNNPKRDITITGQSNVGSEIIYTLYFDPSNIDSTIVLKQNMEFNFTQGGWHLISLPVALNDNNLNTLFPSAKAAYSWETNQYTAQTYLDTCNGYWLSLPDKNLLNIDGEPLKEYTRHYNIGWHLIGGIAKSVDFTNPNDNPNGSVIAAYGWESETNTYFLADTLEPTKGYWIAVVNECDLNIGGDSINISQNTISDSLIQQFYLKYEDLPPHPPEIAIQRIDDIIIPENFSLFQNFPNPFNSSTTIFYQLPKASHVKLAIYNINNQLIEIIVNEHQKAGTHKILWSTDKLDSGIYLYRLTSNDYNAVMKCILLK